MRNTQFKIEDVFGKILGKDDNSQEEKKLNNFLAEMMQKSDLK